MTRRDGSTAGNGAHRVGVGIRVGIGVEPAERDAPRRAAGRPRRCGDAGGGPGARLRRRPRSAVALPGRPEATTGAAEVLRHPVAPHLSRARARCSPPRTWPGRRCGRRRDGPARGGAISSRLVPVMPYLTGLGRDTPEAARLLSAVDAARPQDAPLVPGHPRHRPRPPTHRRGLGPACGPSSTASTPRASPPTWSRPRRATSRSTGTTGSRSPGRSARHAAGRRCG